MLPFTVDARKSGPPVPIRAFTFRRLSSPSSSTGSAEVILPFTTLRSTSAFAVVGSSRVIEPFTVENFTSVAALGIAALFRRTLLRGPVRPMILELPPYRWPAPRSIGVTVWQRSALFLRRAGTVILALSIVLWALATFPRTAVAPDVDPAVAQETQLANSALGRFGRAIEPAVAPLGYDWKIGVSILASFAAREVFVSTMGTIYGVGDAGEAALADELRAERRPDGRPTYTPLVAVSLMVFYVFALMCMSTVAVTVREAGGGRLGWRWAGIQFAYMLGLAYGAAWLVMIVGHALGMA